jgi:lipid-binding SYLF domain-containing protein
MRYFARCRRRKEGEVMTRLRIAVGCGLVLLVAAGPLRAGERELRTVEHSLEVVREFSALPLRGIPPHLLRDAAGVAVIPHVLKAGLIVDARVGHGVVLVRMPDGAWSNPVFVALGGVGIGGQAGVEATDLVLIFKTRHSLDRILRGKGKLTLGGDVTVAAGPVGRDAEAATDARLRAEILSYSRSRGLFAGVSLEGAALRVNREANRSFYGLREGHAAEVMAQRKVGATEGLRAELARLSSPPPPAVVPPPAVIVPPPVTVPPPRR